RTGLDGPTDTPQPMLPNLSFVLDVVAPNSSTATGQRHVDVTAPKPPPTNTERALYWPTVQAVQMQTAADVQVIQGLTADIQTALAVTDIPLGSPLQWVVGEVSDVMDAADRALVRPVGDIGDMVGHLNNHDDMTRDQVLRSSVDFQQHLNVAMSI